jgi:transketolase
MTQDLKEARKICLRLAHKAQDGNLQSAFSSIDMLWTLENKIMNADDIIILSKGQSTLALYAVLIQNGTYFEEEFDNIGKYGGKYSIQVDITKGIKGVYNSAGALGHGLPFACGIAMAKKVKGESGRVFVLVGDGELNEGTMWESFLIAERFKLDNLWIIVDNNSSHSIYSLEKKFKSFALSSRTLWEGNSEFCCENFINTLYKKDKYRAKALIMNTQRGYGCPSMMNGPKWFHRAPNDEELAQLSKEIDEQ